MANSGGNKKKHSPRQKEHYKSHPFRAARNKLARLLRHLKRNAAKVRKAQRTGRPDIGVDKQAVEKYRELGGKW